MNGEVSVQGASPHSTACQIRYLSASNRGTGEDRQHLLSKPNYPLSTKQEGEPAPQPGLRSHTHMHTHAYVFRFDHYRSVRGRPVVIYYLFIGNFVVRSAKPNCSSLGIGVGLVRIHYQLVLCPAALWQSHDGGDCPELKLPVSQEGNYVPAWAVQNHSQSIYGTLSQISLGEDATFHCVALSLSEGLPAVINRSGT